MTKLEPVRIGSKRHLALIKAGYRVHHVDGVIAWMEFQESGKGGKS